MPAARKCSKCGCRPAVPRLYNLCTICDMLMTHVPPGGMSTGWPRTSIGLGCDRPAIARTREAARRAGVPTEYTPSGDAILTSQAHAERLAKAMVRNEGADPK